MALRPLRLDQLHVSWDGSGLAFWALDGGTVASPLALRSLVSVAFGYEGLALVTAAVTPLYQPTPGAPEGLRGRRATYAQSMQTSHQSAYALLDRRHDVEESSTSLRWLYAATDVGVAAARAGLLVPSVQPRRSAECGPTATAGGAWEARWRLGHHVDLERAIAALASQAPDALWAPFAAGAPAAATRSVVEYVADSAARWTLDRGGWRPDLGRSTRANAVMARRVAAGLGGACDVAASNGEQRAAAAAIGLALDRHRATRDAGLGFRCRARLRTPYDESERSDLPIATGPGSVASGSDDAEAAPWRVTFEVVLIDDPAVTFAWSDLVAGRIERHTTQGGVEVTETALAVMTSHIEELAVNLVAEIVEFAHLIARTGVVTLDLDAVTRLVADGVERCAALGCALLVPKELARRRVYLSGRVTTAPGGGPSANLGQAMVDVDWAIALGGHRLTDQEVAALADSKSSLVRLRGEWVRVDAGNVASALEHLAERRRDSSMTPAELLRAAATADRSTGTTAEAIHLLGPESDEEPDDGRDSADGWLADLLAGLPDDRLSEADEPPGFVGVLRPYQRRAVGWLGFLARLGLGGCLADDMGLGKTPTTLAHLVGHPGDRPSLVLCPLSVVHNWAAEAAVFAPKLRVVIAHGASRKQGEELAEQLNAADLVITTYGTVARDIESLSTHPWNIVVCDEAQAIKNHRTRAARAVRALDAGQVVALTGTPVENRLTELWAILDAVNPGSLGGLGWFRDTFATPIETDGDEGALNGMKRLTGPFLLRRTKADKTLVPDLPDKVEQVAWAHLTEEQVGLYQAVLDDFLAEAGDGESDREGEGDDPMQRRGRVLATLTKLKQICNHPAQFLAAGGEEPGRLPGRSGKLARFDEVVAELLAADERALVFTQYREMGELLVAHLAATHGVRAPFLHGGVPRARRDEMVTDFQSGDGPLLQVVSLKAGGTGLNLTSASRVIHYDRWWNPAVEDQATDRAWRIGQQATVFVHKLVCRGTLEERIDALLQDKKALANSAVGSGEAWLTEMSTDELRGLLALGTPTAADPAEGGS